MYKIYNNSKDKFIAYNRHKSNKKDSPNVIFIHGLMSNMQGAKANYLEQYCKKRDYNFIKFDNFGHGQSSSKFTDETIGSWFLGLELVIQKLVQNNNPIVLVGSSMGAWLALLSGIKFSQKLQGIVCISAAPDFTELSIWQKLPPIKQRELQTMGYIEVSGSNCDEKYPISYNLIKEARHHILLDKPELNITCPVHLIHGMLDRDVSHVLSQQLLEKILSKNVILKMIKDGDHGLSRSTDITIITNSIEEVLLSC